MNSTTYERTNCLYCEKEFFRSTQRRKSRTLQRFCKDSCEKGANRKVNQAVGTEMESVLRSAYQMPSAREKEPTPSAAIEPEESWEDFQAAEKAKLEETHKKRVEKAKKMFLEGHEPDDVSERFGAVVRREAWLALGPERQLEARKVRTPLTGFDNVPGRAVSCDIRFGKAVQ